MEKKGREEGKKGREEKGEESSFSRSPKDNFALRAEEYIIAIMLGGICKHFS